MIIQTNHAPAAIGPYSQAILANDVLYTSGQVALSPANGAVVGQDIRTQAETACNNLGAILSAAGMDFEDVVKTTCFLSDMADFSAFNEVYASYFVSSPARSCVAVKELPKGVLCEIEAIAVKNNKEKEEATTNA